MVTPGRTAWLGSETTPVTVARLLCAGATRRKSSNKASVRPSRKAATRNRFPIIHLAANSTSRKRPFVAARLHPPGNEKQPYGRTSCHALLRGSFMGERDIKPLAKQASPLECASLRITWHWLSV